MRNTFLNIGLLVDIPASWNLDLKFRSSFSEYVYANECFKWHLGSKNPAAQPEPLSSDAGLEVGAGSFSRIALPPTDFDNCSDTTCRSWRVLREDTPPIMEIKRSESVNNHHSMVLYCCLRATHRCAIEKFGAHCRPELLLEGT